MKRVPSVVRNTTSSSIELANGFWQRSRRSARLRFVGAWLLLGASTGQAEAPSIAELDWIRPESERVRVLTTAPAECRLPSATREEKRSADLGRVAFRSPVLLGGLAARVGMRCDTCHRNGHDNPFFHFPGVSGAAGTADVTGSVFSRQRDDGIRNPVPIPTLVDRGAAPPFGRVLPAPTLEVFLRTAIVEEFQGAVPPPAVAEGLAAYLRSLQSSACQGEPNQPIRFDQEAEDALATFDLVAVWSAEQDIEVRRFLLRSLRAHLERIYRRFPATVARREGLVEVSRALGAMVSALARDPVAGGAVDAVAREDLEGVFRDLRVDAERSYYEPAILRRHVSSIP